MTADYLKGFSVGLAVGGLVAFLLMALLSFLSLWLERREMTRRARLRAKLKL
jgi:hypothetical protein